MAERQDPKLIAKRIVDKQKEILGSFSKENQELLQATTFMATFSSLELIKIILTSGNMGLITNTLNELETLLKASLTKVSVKVTSAAPLSEIEREELKKIFKKQFNKDIILDTHIDEKILGGLMIEYEGKVIDLSLSEELVRLKKHLLSSLKKD